MQFEAKRTMSMTRSNNLNSRRILINPSCYIWAEMWSCDSIHRFRMVKIWIWLWKFAKRYPLRMSQVADIPAAVWSLENEELLSRMPSQIKNESKSGGGKTNPEWEQCMYIILEDGKGRNNGGVLPHFTFAQLAGSCMSGKVQFFSIWKRSYYISDAEKHRLQLFHLHVQSQVS